MTSNIEKIITIGILAGIGVIAAKNWSSISTIGSNVSSSISSGLSKIASTTVQNASKE